jgi:hypothetical protein
MVFENIVFDKAIISFTLDTDIDDCFYMYVDDNKGHVYKAPILIEDYELVGIYKKMKDFRNSKKQEELTYEYIRISAVGAVQLTKKWG